MFQLQRKIMFLSCLEMLYYYSVCVLGKEWWPQKANYYYTT